MQVYQNDTLVRTDAIKIQKITTDSLGVFLDWFRLGKKLKAQISFLSGGNLKIADFGKDWWTHYRKVPIIRLKRNHNVANAQKKEVLNKLSGQWMLETEYDYDGGKLYGYNSYVYFEGKYMHDIFRGKLAILDSFDFFPKKDTSALTLFFENKNDEGDVFFEKSHSAVFIHSATYHGISRWYRKRKK